MLAERRRQAGPARRLPTARSSRSPSSRQEPRRQLPRRGLATSPAAAWSSPAPTPAPAPPDSFLQPRPKSQVPARAQQPDAWIPSSYFFFFKEKKPTRWHSWRKASLWWTALLRRHGGTHLCRHTRPWQPAEVMDLFLEWPWTTSCSSTIPSLSKQHLQDFLPL